MSVTAELLSEVITEQGLVIDDFGRLPKDDASWHNVLQSLHLGPFNPAGDPSCR